MVAECGERAQSNNRTPNYYRRVLRTWLLQMTLAADGLGCREGATRREKRGCEEIWLIEKTRRPSTVAFQVD